MTQPYSSPTVANGTPDVVPALQRRRCLPPGGLIGTWRAVDGCRLRVAHWPGPAAAASSGGTILFLNGRGDFIEKYAESYWAFRDWGYAIATLDWRGQGLSDRFAGDRERGHQQDIGQLVADVAAWIDAEGHDWPRPLHLVAHSMGGNIALRLLHDHPGLVERAVVMAPMLGIRTRPLPVAVARRLARWQVARGHGFDFALAQGPYGEMARSVHRQRNLTGDAERFDDEHWWISGNPDLSVGGVTYGWLDAAFRSIDCVRAPGYLEAIATPVLILAAGIERLVDSAAAIAAATRLPRGTARLMEGGRHELVREVDSIRLETFGQIRSFLAGRDGE